MGIADDITGNSGRSPVIVSGLGYERSPLQYPETHQRFDLSDQRFGKR